MVRCQAQMAHPSSPVRTRASAACLKILVPTAALPGLRPTAGYPVDAERFLADTAELRARARVADEILVRSR